MTDKQIIIDGKECRYWFRPNPDDYRKCSLRGKDDNCDEIKDCFIKELLGKLALKEQECEELEKLYKELQDDMLSCNKCRATIKLQQQLDQLKQTIAEIKKIAEGMHDLWINKTPYTDKNNLVEHLLECELNRIRYKLDEISESEGV